MQEICLEEEMKSIYIDMCVGPFQRGMVKIILDALLINSHIQIEDKALSDLLI